MLRYKWILSLGIAAVAPGITLAGPFSIFKSDKTEAASVDSQKQAEDVAAALRAAKINGYDVDIEVRNGVCVLKGRIDSQAHKDQASAAASRVSGIKSVDNQMQVTNSKTGVEQAVAQGAASNRVQPAGFFNRKSEPSAPAASSGSDQETAQRIAQAVGQSGVRGHDIDLKVINGVAVMNGRAQSPRDVAFLTQVVSQVPGVRGVENRMLAPGMMPPAPPAAPKTQNQLVAEQIAQALAMNQLGGQDIEVRFNNGTALLGGVVSHPAQKAAAEKIAASVPGVNQVQNSLQIGQSLAGQPMSPIQQVSYQAPGGGMPGMPMPPMPGHGGSSPSHLAYDMPQLPPHAWPSYSSYPNYAAVTYPTQHSASAWPYIGPFYPYPQVPLGWRQVQLEWDDGYWNLNFRPRTDKWFWYFDPKNW